MEQVIIRELNMPDGIKGFVKLDSEGDYNVYINAKYNIETKIKVFEHELRHIENCDFYSDLCIEDVEGIGPAK